MFYIVIAGFIIIFFLALGARSLKSFSRHKLEDYCKSHNNEARLTAIIKNYERVACAVTLLRIIAAFVFVGFLVLHDPPKTDITAAEVARFIGYILGILLTIFYFPRVIAKLWGTVFVYHTWRFWSLLAALAIPLTVIDRFISVFFHRLADVEEGKDEDEFEEEIRMMVTEGHREGLLEDDAREIIEGAMKLQDISVSEIMTPRTDMRCIEDVMSWNEMLQYVATCPHSRIPVFHETRDDIVGILHTKTLLRELIIPDPTQRRHWTELLDEPLFIPETKPVDALLKEFQNIKVPGHLAAGNMLASERARGHLAIVLDEYGGVSGIVTLEDLLEEIVGEITDEHDTVVKKTDIEQLSLNVYEVLGKVRIDELNRELELHLPDEDDYDTAAGYIFSALGHIPEVGEAVNFEHDGKAVKLTVTEMNKRRIERIRIEK